MRRFQLNPITRKRLQRFKALKRSYYSFWLLLALYAFGLLADVLFNDKPLFVRYEGEWYFPAFVYYPDDTFTGSGLHTRANYKAIARMDRFAGDPDNFMVFPPYPYGPNESITGDQIDVDENVYAVVRRQQLVGTVDIDEAFETRRAVSAAEFFGAASDRELRGARFLERFPASEKFREAVAARFANDRALPAFEERVSADDDLAVELSLPPYEPRARAPSATRVTLREVVSESAPTSRIAITPEGEVAHPGDLWPQLSAEQQAAILERARERLLRPLQPMPLQIEGRSFQAEFLKEDVFFPFRPTGNHWMGLDSSGRDVFSRVVYALRISMNFGILLVVASMAIGIAIGGLQGYIGGKFDLLGQRGIEIWEALPFLYVMILMGSVFGPSFELLLIIYALFSWIGISYYMRGEFLKLRKQPFVEAAHCLGLSGARIMGRHILPNALVPVITFFPFSLVSAIGALSALDYLGFGLPPPTPSWGELFAQAQEFRYAWWLVLYPFVALFLVGLLGVFVGEGIRAAFDPRANTRYES